MADVSNIVGIIMMVIGGLLATAGMVLCYTTKGEYYNAEEVQAMVAAEVLEEEKKKKQENEEQEKVIRESVGKTMAEEGLGGGDAEEGLGGATEEAKTVKKKRRGPLIAS